MKTDTPETQAAAEKCMAENDLCILITASAKLERERDAARAECERLRDAATGCTPLSAEQAREGTFVTVRADAIAALLSCIPSTLKQ